MREELALSGAKLATDITNHEDKLAVGFKLIAEERASVAQQQMLEAQQAAFATEQAIQAEQDRLRKADE